MFALSFFGISILSDNLQANSLNIDAYSREVRK